MTKEKNNDYLAELFGRQNSPIDAYRNLVNQPTSIDRMGQNFINEGNAQPGLTHKQRLTGTALRGFGSGMQMSQDTMRAEKLAGLEEAAKNIAMQDMNLKEQLGKSQLRKEQLVNFGNKQIYTLKGLNDDVGKGDWDNATIKVRYLLNDLSKINPEITKQFGDNPQVYNGMVLFNRPGNKIEGIPLNDFAYEAIKYLDPETQRELPNLLTYTAKSEIDMQDAGKQATLAKLQAEGANQYSQANYHNAQADVAKHEMHAPEYNKDVANHHLGYLEKARESNLKNEALANTLGEFIENIKEAKKEGAAGATPLANLTRKYQKLLAPTKM